MRHPRPQRGFTLIELMIVISIILLIISIAIPSYQRSMRHARETKLRETLYMLRGGIQSYLITRQQLPTSLQEMVEAGTIREIPVDPMTNQRDWLEEEEAELLDPVQPPGMTNVRSKSSEVGSDGRPYSEW